MAGQSNSAGEQTPEVSMVNESRHLRCVIEGCVRGARAKSLCGLHYQRVRTNGTTEKLSRVAKQWATCGVEGCGNPSRTVCGPYCEMHYYRMRRTGVFDAREPASWRQTDHGYLCRNQYSNPIAAKGGIVYQHRDVLYRSIGDGVHECHWCKCEIQWRAAGKRRLVVDHLNGVKNDNRLQNLVASCHRCNATRGLFQAWVIEHKDDPFLVQMFDESRARKVRQKSAG